MKHWSKQKILKRITLQWQQLGISGHERKEVQPVTIYYKSSLSFGWSLSVFILNTKYQKMGYF